MASNIIREQPFDSPDLEYKVHSIPKSHLFPLFLCSRSAFSFSFMFRQSEQYNIKGNRSVHLGSILFVHELTNSHNITHYKTQLAALQMATFKLCLHKCRMLECDTIFIEVHQCTSCNRRRYVIY